MKLSEINFVIKQFYINSKVLNINKIDSGLINDTYVVEHFYNGEKSKFILQSLSKIFDSNEVVNMNHNIITNHIKNKIKTIYLDSYNQRWEVPSLVKCKSNDLFLFHFESNCWRAMEYIDHTFSSDSIENELMAYESGLGLAKFHSFCSELDFSKLGESIRNFHNLSYYIEQFNISIYKNNLIDFDNEVKKRIEYLIYNLSDHISYARILFNFLNKKLRDYSVLHGDPKLSNFLFDIKYKYVVSLIDLDTISVGFLSTDLADCLRSICNLNGEDPKCLDNVFFDMNACRNFLNGYFSIYNQDNNDSFKFLPEFIYLIILELTIRFLTDFLQSNKYFKIKYDTHNLFRAEVQFQLLYSFMTQTPILKKELNEIGIPLNSIFVSDLQKFV
tara:strand:+ start:805 stop:1968 length:1164 start_codon:yes stop_codon:yes gene_type:complete